jgi:2,3-bisphosphoglycerate-independent phosphoglycerate mutase
MKYAIILPDGAMDEPVESLDGRTPPEAARKPNMDWISANGRQENRSALPQKLATSTLR